MLHESEVGFAFRNGPPSQPEIYPDIFVSDVAGLLATVRRRQEMNSLTLDFSNPNRGDLVPGAAPEPAGALGGGRRSD